MKLTERNFGTPDLNSLIHIVNTGETSPQSPNGTSYKTALGDLTGLFGDNYIEVTYSELTTLISNSGLTEGSFYLIEDFQTIYDQPDFDSFGSAKGSVDTKTGSTEPIVVLSTSNNTISNNAWSLTYPNDKISYDVTFNQTEVMNVPAKGRISERIDDRNNRTDYDHRSVLFKRYETINGSSIFNSYKDTGFNSTEILTFQYDLYTNGNYIGDFTWISNVYYGPFLLSNNVFNSNAESNTLSDACINNTFGQSCYYNNIGEFSFNNIFGNNFTNNIIASYCQGNIFGDSCDSNVIDQFFQDNGCGDYFGYNKIMDSFYDNQISTNFGENFIGSEFNNNTIGDGFGNSRIGSDFNNNVIGDGWDTNNVGSYFRINMIGNNFDFNTIGSDFFDNSIGNNMTGNIIGHEFNDNTIGDSFRDNNISNGFSGNTTSNNFNKNITLNNIYDVDFTGSTHVYQNYTCEIVERQDGALRLKYMDNTDAIIVTDITD